MINAVVGSHSQAFRTEHPKAQQTDTLTAKRSAESRQLAIAAINQQQREKVQQAVAAYMSLAVESAGDRAERSMPLSQAQRAYAEF